MRRELSDREYLYIWVEGVHTGVRLGSEGRLCCLLLLGARLDGRRKELLAIEDGYRQSTESWASLFSARPQQARHEGAGACGGRRGRVGFLGGR